ncbi:MAG: ATP-dependent helicase [Pseudomonadota bacterium]
MLQVICLLSAHTKSSGELPNKGGQMSWNAGLEPGTPAFVIAGDEAQRLRVIAGPGTGKSFAMKRRVARLLESGVPASRILPVTFTRVAAEDLHRELVQMGVAGCEELQGRTLHSLALSRLMRAHVLLATGRTPRPLNDFEIGPLLSDLMATHGGKNRVKRELKAYEAAFAREQGDQPGALTAEEVAFQNDLLRWLRFHEGMLIGEVVPIFHEYIRNDPHAPERAEFTHILVDEYQDLNRAEQQLVEFLAVNAEVCIVGDDDQSIYSFRHAHPAGIREWEEGNAPTDVGLNECRRCPVQVVRMATSLISRNVLRDADRILDERAENGQGVVAIIRYQNLQAEVVGVAERVKEFIVQGVPPGDILVLAQRGVIGTPIYESLIERDVPVRSYYSEAELETEFAQERYTYLRIVAGQNDKVALRWLLGLFGNNWNAAGYKRLREYCEANHVGIWQALESLASGEIHIPYTGPLTLRFEEIRARKDYLSGLLEQGGIAAVIDELFPADEPRVRDLRTLLSETLSGFPDADMAEFLRLTNEAIAKPEIPEEVTDVRVMSLHKSKGLSAPVTFVAGCIEGLLPQRAPAGSTPQQELDFLEEQRRLFYVGITRVKASTTTGKPGTLILTSSREMPMATALGAGIAPAQIVYGAARMNVSRFLGEFGGHSPAPIAG